MKKKRIVSTVLCSVFLFGGLAMLVLGAVMLDGNLCENDTNLVMPLPPSPPMGQPPSPPLAHHRSLQLVAPQIVYRANSNGVYMDDCKVISIVLIIVGIIVSLFSCCVCLRLATSLPPG